MGIVPDALAQACIHSFKRFDLQRGYLQVVLSDNGSPSIGNNMQEFVAIVIFNGNLVSQRHPIRVDSGIV